LQNSDVLNGKVILLYMLHQVRGVCSSDLMKWAVDSLYLDYFTYTQAKEELKRDKLIIESVRKEEKKKDTRGIPAERCDITPEGEVVLHNLLHTLPSHVRAYLTNASLKWNLEQEREASVEATYQADANGAYLVRLELLDGRRITADLCISVPTAEIAEQICRKWKKSTFDIYASLLKSLQPDLE